MQVEQFLGRLVRDYPELKFRAGKRFKYRPPRTVYYERPTDGPKMLVQKCDETGARAVGGPKTPCEANTGLEQNYYFLQFLHEVGHALAGHRDYTTDLERIKMEREAWEKARGLCEKYGVEYDEEFVEMEMDTYREWLHRRSQCRECGLTMYQTKDGKYHCPRCENFGE